MQSDSKAIVRQLYEEVWNKRRLELFDEIISPSHALHDPTLTGAAVGPEAYKRQVTRFVAAFPDLRFTVQDIVGEKEKLAVAWTISGTHNGEYSQRRIHGNSLHKQESFRGRNHNTSHRQWKNYGFLRQLGRSGHDATTWRRRSPWPWTNEEPYSSLIPDSEVHRLPCAPGSRHNPD